MSLLTNRIIWSDNGVLKDLSISLNEINELTEVVPFVAAEDFLFIGSELPFNQRFFRLSVAQTNATVPTVSIWDGSAWKTAVDLLDESDTSGDSLAKSGVISFRMDKEEGRPGRDDTDKMTEGPSGLETLKIYDLYWTRWAWSSDWSGTTALSYVGYKFSDDLDLAAQYPQLGTSDIKTQFGGSGTTDYEPQQLEAAKTIVRDLTQRDALYSTNQILDHQQFRHASNFRVAMTIFSELGNDYDNDYERAKGLYEESLRVIIRADKNRNTRLDVSEQFNEVDVVRR